MNLRLGSWYKLRQVDQAIGLSYNSSEESVTHPCHLLEPILEEDIYSISTSNMCMDAHVTKVPEYSMTFNMRLTFVRTNGHGAQLYKDPMNRWVVKVEDHLIAFEATPWVNYQGELYMGQRGECFIVTKGPKDLYRWGQLIKIAKKKELAYGDLEELKLLNLIKVYHMKVGDPNIALYVKESEESLSCSYARNLAPNTINAKKVLYVYLEEMLTMKLTPIFLENFGITYEPME